jgi:hypothetical protein
MTDYVQSACGITEESKEYVRKHLKLIGAVEKVELRRLPRSAETRIIGRDGTITVDGFEWGYHGEGPKGLLWLLNELGWTGYRIGDIVKVTKDHTFTRMNETI